LKAFLNKSTVGTPILKQHCTAYYIVGAFEYSINKAQLIHSPCAQVVLMNILIRITKTTATL
jgi:hypothetical protein